MKKIAEGVAIWKKYALYKVTGVVQSEATRAETEVSGSVGGGAGITIQGSGGSVPVSGTVSSTTTRYQTIYLKDDDGGERALRLVDFVIPCREGHKLTARGVDKSVWFDIDNNSTGEGWENKRELRKYVSPDWLFRWAGPAAIFVLVLIIVSLIPGVEAGVRIPMTIFYGLIGAIFGRVFLFRVAASVISRLRASKIRAALKGAEMQSGAIGAPVKSS